MKKNLLICYANIADTNELSELDHHINKDVLLRKIENNEVYIVKNGQRIIGLLRYSLFWDNTPFLNLLYINKEYQKKGYGTELIKFWENEMKNNGYRTVMTSTLSTEEAQHFYRKNGYIDIGGFIMPNEPFELLFLKQISV